MAVINSDTIERAKRTLFYRVNARNVPVQLPFAIVTIDEDRQFYEPLPRVRLSEQGNVGTGRVWDAVFLDRNQRLPVNGPPVFSYYGF